MFVREYSFFSLTQTNCKENNFAERSDVDETY